LHERFPRNPADIGKRSHKNVQRRCRRSGSQIAVPISAEPRRDRWQLGGERRLWARSPAISVRERTYIGIAGNCSCIAGIPAIHGHKKAGIAPA
jgi:hypothetical protein